jgi:biopolymer transport protein ExbD
MADLRAALQVRMRSGTPPPLVLVADRELPYQSLRAVMSAAAAAGLNEISFAVRRKEGS